MSDPSNALRGEASLSIGENTFVLRPNFSALVLAEDELGSLFALVERASGGSLTVAEVTCLLWHCLPTDNRPDRDTVGKAVIALGLIEAIKPIKTILSQVMKGGG
ncbi:MAG: gene transfer agent family protein [Pseudomonadota bacterium]